MISEMVECTEKRVPGPRLNSEEHCSEAFGEGVCEETQPMTLMACCLSDKCNENHLTALSYMLSMSCKYVRRMMWSNISSTADKSRSKWTPGLHQHY